MKSLNFEQMEIIEGGRNWFACAAGLSTLIGVAMLIASTPVTGPLGAGVAYGVISGSIGTGYSFGECFSS